MDPLGEALRGLPSPPILVVGDLILDRYIEGSAQRVSPEAPVLVFETRTERHLLGGACNVASNLVALGAKTTVLGAIGDDAGGHKLLAMLAQEGIDTQAVVRDPSRPTTRKTRYVSKTSQILRVDEELRHGLDGSAAAAAIQFLARRPFPFRAVLLSDYGKGMLSRPVIASAIEAAHSAGALAVVDPKGRDYSIYRGVDLLTPNREEAEAATGVQIHGTDALDLHRAAARLREITGVRSASITLGKDGIYFEDENGAGHVLPTEARQVFDVTGAGDAVVAIVTLARCCGLSLRDSLRLANVGAGIVVGHFGTWAVSRAELLAALGHGGPGKLLTRDEAVGLAARLRTEGKRLVFTNGCFDLLHPGHCEYLERARSCGDLLLVAVNTDRSVQRQQKGPGRPINPLADRMAVLAALAAVDYVVPFDEDTPEQLIQAVTPHVLVKGEDWRNKGVVGRDWVEAHGGQVVLVPLRPGSSTSAIIDRIRGSSG
jgi:D-beta-D-heptose 7-phosphate kinase/D-beta-D-heptose 1-phosphate adenosyltransferase